jgi:hypothetical protein
MRRAERRIRRTKGDSKHRRGNFTALATGVSFGGGQKVWCPASDILFATNFKLMPQLPGNLVNTKKNTAILDEILESTAFIRLARFANSKYLTFRTHMRPPIIVQ